MFLDEQHLKANCTVLLRIFPPGYNAGVVVTKAIQ